MDRKARKIENFSVLEMHVEAHFRNTKEPLIENGETFHEHILEEFLEGYSGKNEETGWSTYAESEEDNKLIQRFIKVVESDVEGSYEYQPADGRAVIEAIEKFGL